MVVENILIYEDDGYRNFLPLAYARPVYDLATGMSTLLSKITDSYSEAIINLHCRTYLKDVTKQNHPGISVNNINTGVTLLLVNGRTLVDEKFSLNLDTENKLFLDQYNEVVALFLSRDNTVEIRDLLGETFSSKNIITAFRNKVKIETVDIRLVDYPWELINDNAHQIVYDFKRLRLSGLIKSFVPRTVVTKKEHFIYIGKDCELADFCILDSSEGPIYIGDNCKLESFTVVKGPCYVGKGSNIQGNIANVSIGPASVVKGNILNTIVGSVCHLENVSNISYSYFSDGTQVFDNVKNENQTKAANVREHIYLDGYQLETNERYLGVYTGDYANIQFSSYLTSGTVIGVGSETIQNDVAARFIPSFIAGELTGYVEKSLNQVNDDISVYLQSKGLEFTDVEKDLVKEIYSISAERKLSNLIE